MTDSVKSKPKRFKRWMLRGAFVFVGLYVLLIYIVPLFFQIPEKLTTNEEQSIEFTDRDGVPMRQLLNDGLRVDEPATFKEIPKNLIDATLAAEDARFRSHNGIDYRGNLRAIRDLVLNRRIVSGGSTVTQQLIKVTSKPRPREIRTKIIEMFTARKLEMSWSKDEILTAYLNRLPYGNQLTGCRAAARGYFGKPIGDLSLAEASFLAGLPNKPTRFNPYKNFEGAKKRQLHVLGRMHDEGWITEQEFASASGESLKLTPRDSVAFEAPHFIDLLLGNTEGSQMTAGPAVTQKTIKTTIDLELQEFVEQAIDNQISRLADQTLEDHDIQGAVVVIDNETGEVLALIGSRDFFDIECGQVNGAWAPRSAGSTLKPFTYLLALQKGYTAGTVIPDLPVEYVTQTGAYRPVNFDRRFNGPVTLRHALANSLNVPAVRVLDDLGGADSLRRLMVENLGFTGLNSADHYGLGITLGTAEVRLLELTNAYACLARLGVHKPVRLTIEEGRPTNQQGTFDEQTLFDHESAFIIADILSDNRARMASFGIDSPLRFPFRVACKTGTSTDFRDNWTIGFTPEYTVGVWVGQFNNAPLQNVSGVSGAGPVFHEIMEHLHESISPTWYDRPDSLVEVEIDPINGKQLFTELEDRIEGAMREVFRPDFVPPHASASDYSVDGKALLPRIYASWFAGENHLLSDRVAIRSFDGRSDRMKRFQIVSPMTGTVAFLDPDLPQGGNRFPLRVSSSDFNSIEWSSATLQIESSGSRVWVVLQPGEHVITATDSKSGLRSSSRFQVEAL